MCCERNISGKRRSEFCLVSCSELTHSGFRLDELASLRKQAEDTRWAIEQNERRFNIDRAADLKFNVSVNSIKAKFLFGQF